jgi:hypothetical protein
VSSACSVGALPLSSGTFGPRSHLHNRAEVCTPNSLGDRIAVKPLHSHLPSSTVGAPGARRLCAG